LGIAAVFALTRFLDAQVKHIGGIFFHSAFGEET
jgi:hypothetical protein